MEGPVVAFAGEVEPFGVTELIAHEVEPAFAAERERDEANHFVEGDAAFDDGVVVALAHVPVHFLIHQAEGEGLVADECLVVTFGVGDGCFAVAAVAEGRSEFVEVPIFVALFLEQFDPVIGDAHGESVGETDAAFFEGAAESGHAGHVFGDGDGAGFEVVDQLGGELEVEDGILIGIGAKVVVIAAKGLVATRVVEHGGDAIEAKAVEMEFLEPVADVGEQEVADLGSAVVEALGIPLRVLAAIAGVEILVAGAIEVVESLRHVFHGMGVNDVEQHREVEPVGGIDQVFEIFGCAEA